MPKTKKQRLANDFSLNLHGEWGGRIMPKQDDPEWKIFTYRGIKLAYDMLCDPTRSDK